ncbi:MAG: GH25 family lysozyme [Paracoccaceae bacterium]
MKALYLLPLLACLAACGGHPDPGAITPAPAGVITAPNFGDADPHDWSGRRPESYPVHGIDASRWQGTIDWSTARANGVNFAFLKATEGGDGLDPMFADNRRAARAAGVPAGAYHFWYHCRSAAEQARWFIRHVPRAAGDLPPVVDMEWTPTSPTCRKRPPAEQVRAEAALFLSILERHYGQRPIVYATPDFYADTQLWRLGGYDFWLRSTAAHPRDTFDGRHWTFWQYTGTGIVPGVRGRADINVFAGSAASWQSWLKARRQD